MVYKICMYTYAHINLCMFRSLDLDKCPQRIVCEFGSFILPVNSTQIPTAKTLTSYLVDQAMPKGKARKYMKQLEKAFWLGSFGSGQCSHFNCQPAFHVYHQDTPDYPNPELNEARGQNTKLKRRKKVKGTNPETHYEYTQNDQIVQNQHGHQQQNYNFETAGKTLEAIKQHWSPHSLEGYETKFISPTINYEDIKSPTSNFES